MPDGCLAFIQFPLKDVATALTGTLLRRYRNLANCSCEEGMPSFLSIISSRMI